MHALHGERLKNEAEDTTNRTKGQEVGERRERQARDTDGGP